MTVRRMFRASELFPRGLALFLLATAFAKLFKPVMLCGPDPFESANMLMMPVEFFSGIWLWLPGAGRRRAALLITVLMPVAAVYLIHMHLEGHDVAACGCFGPLRVPLGIHLAVQAAVCAAATMTFLRERARARSDSPDGPRRLRQLFR
jgi:hypothetical protein